MSVVQLRLFKSVTSAGAYQFVAALESLGDKDVKNVLYFDVHRKSILHGLPEFWSVSMSYTDLIGLGYKDINTTVDIPVESGEIVNKFSPRNKLISFYREKAYYELRKYISEKKPEILI